MLVGEDSLEANVGHLAALTGGDIHFSFGADVGGALHAALHGLRTKRMAEEQGMSAGGQLPESVCAIRGNVRMSATWSGKPTSAASGRDTLSEGVAAYAANLALTSLSESMARKLAVGEGLVTHLTSLVLVDEAGPVQEALPVTRKVNLPTPRTAGSRYYMRSSPAVCYDRTLRRTSPSRESSTPFPPPLTEATYNLAPPSPDMPESEKEEQRDRQAENLYIITSWIDWKREGPTLAGRSLSGLEPAVAASIRALANHKDILETAAKWGIDPVRLAIALVAAWAMEHNAGWGESTERHADRVRRRLLKGVDIDAFGAYFKQFDPEADRGDILRGGSV